MKELVHKIAQALVDSPEMVSIREVYGGLTTIFELRVAKSDLGKIIGKNGRNANALRVILNAASAKKNKRAILEIVNSADTKTDNHQPQDSRLEEIEKV